MNGMSKDIMSIAGLVLALLVLLILVGVTFVVSEKFKENLCTTADSTYVYEGGNCLNATGGSEVALTGITQSEVVEGSIITVLSFLAIVVIVLIAKIIIKVARSMSDE